MYNNQNLELFLMNYFHKKITEITDEEMNKLETLSLDGIDITGLYEKIDFEIVINMFPNLKKILISNYVFDEKDIENIAKSNALKYDFYKCDFSKIEKIDMLKNIEELYLERCILKTNDLLYTEFTNMKILSIINPSNEEEVNLEKLTCINIEKIYLENCIISNQECINKFKNLEYVDIINTSAESIFIEKLLENDKMKELNVLEQYISDEQKNKFAEKNVIVKYNNNEELFESEKF